MRRLIPRLAIPSLGLLLVLTHAASTAVVTPTGALHDDADFGTNSVNLINGNGLIGAGPVLTRTHEGTTFNGNWFWLSDNFAGTLTFTLPSPSELEAVHLWQYSQGACCTARGVSTMDMSFSTDGGSTFPVTMPGLTWNQASGTANEPVQTQTFAPVAGVTHVRFSNMDDFPTGPNPGYLGLGEVRFSDTTPSPPPPPITGGTGPGGFTPLGPASEISLWLRGDAGVTKDSSDRVSSWADQSGHANDVAQGNLDRQPLQNTAANGVPLVTFDGGDAPQPDEMISASGVTAQTVFLVNSTLSHTTGDPCCNPMIGNSNTYVSIRHSTNSQTWQHPGDTNDFTNPAGSAMYVDGAPGNAAPFNELQVLTAARNGAFNFTNLKLAQHRDFAPRAWNGSLGEVLVWGRPLGSAERQIVENHLSAKFDVDLAAGDLYAGDKAAQGDYDLDVFGIGQAGSFDVVSSAGSQGMGLSSGSLEDGQWALAGHKSPTNDWVTTDLPPEAHARWDRVWYVDQTGSPAVTLAFDHSDGGLAPPDPGTPLGLLYSPTNAFSFSFLDLQGTVNGDLVTFALAAGQLQDGYYTLAIVPEPSSVLLAIFGMVAVALAVRRRRGAA